MERLCLVLAFIGALLCVGGIYGSKWIRQTSNLDMPVFQKSKPAVADWPRHVLHPRG